MSVRRRQYKRAAVTCRPCVYFFFFSSRRRHTRLQGDWSSDVCSSDLTSRTGACGCSRTCRSSCATPASAPTRDRKSTRLNSSHLVISYAVFCLKKKNNDKADTEVLHPTYQAWLRRHAVQQAIESDGSN